MVIVGFSGAKNSPYYFKKYSIRYVGHDSSVAILTDGKLAYAAEEERFNLEKHTAELPFRALSNGLEHCGLKWEDIDCFTFPWSTSPLEVIKTASNYFSNVPLRFWGSIGKAGIGVWRDAMSANIATRELGRKMDKKTKAKIIPVDHHQAHAASSYALSGFDNAAVLSVDGNGGHLSSLSGEWKNGKFRSIHSISSPHSLGVLYGFFTEFLGFRSGYDEYKVMGMAAYGNPGKHFEKVQNLIRNSAEGFTTKYTGLILNLHYVMKEFERCFGFQRRLPKSEILQIHFDLAASIQKAVEIQLFRMVHFLKTATGSDNLCLSGGVFQNSVANGKILQSNIFKNVFVPPAPGDNGTALGAALWCSTRVFDEKVKFDPGELGFTGPEYSENTCLDALNEYSEDVAFNKVDNINLEASKLLSGDKIIGWFQGRMEIGSRALGNRSILASPAKLEMKEKLNCAIKNRENFRPFASSITRESASAYFEIDQESPYMQFVVPIREDKIKDLEATNHFGTCRIQTVDKEHQPVFHSLLKEFEKLTGNPVLLNTSFNGKDEPIVCNPKQAIQTFLKLKLDALILGNYLVVRK